MKLIVRLPVSLFILSLTTSPPTLNSLPIGALLFSTTSVMVIKNIIFSSKALNVRIAAIIRPERDKPTASILCCLGFIILNQSGQLTSLLCGDIFYL